MKMNMREIRTKRLLLRPFRESDYVMGINCLKRLDSHTMAGFTMVLSSIIQLKEVPPC